MMCSGLHLRSIETLPRSRSQRFCLDTANDVFQTMRKTVRAVIVSLTQQAVCSSADVDRHLLKITKAVVWHMLATLFCRECMVC